MHVFSYLYDFSYSNTLNLPYDLLIIWKKMPSLWFYRLWKSLQNIAMKYIYYILSCLSLATIEILIHVCQLTVAHTVIQLATRYI